MMPPQPHRNGSQFAGDAPTRLLAPVGDATQILGRSYGQPCQRDAHLWSVNPGVVHCCIHCGERSEKLTWAATAVIPVTPAQPQADWNKPELPDCKKKATAMGVLFGAGVVAGVPIGMVLLFVILMAKVAM